MNTQNASESSLSEELSIFEYGGFSRPSGNNLPAAMSSQATPAPSSSVRGDPDMHVELDLDELNQHPSMAAFVELIQSLVANGVTPVYEAGQLPAEMPPWMSFLHRKVKDRSCSKRISSVVLLFCCLLEQFNGLTLATKSLPMGNLRRMQITF